MLINVRKRSVYKQMLDTSMSRNALKAIMLTHLCFWVIGFKAQRHALTEVNSPACGDVDLISLSVHKRQTTTARIEVSTSQGLHVKVS